MLNNIEITEITAQVKKLNWVESQHGTKVAKLICKYSGALTESCWQNSWFQSDEK